MWNWQVFLNVYVREDVHVSWTWHHTQKQHMHSVFAFWSERADALLVTAGHKKPRWFFDGIFFYFFFQPEQEQS